MIWPADLPVVPVVAVPSAEVAVLLARALADGGMPVIEVTLRSDAALPAIAAIREALPEVLCGAGTLLTPSDVKAAVDVGSQFLVSPGSPDPLVDAMLDTGLICLPGAATPTEAMRLRDRGVRMAKFFPAEASGGAAALRALAGPLPDLRWCATGGISAANAAEYLSVSTVDAVGGSWMVPSGAVDEGRWDDISRLAESSLAAAASKT